MPARYRLSRCHCKAEPDSCVFHSGRGRAVIQICRSPLVATQHAIYQTTDIGNAETWATVAMVAIAGVVDRSRTPVIPTSVSHAVTATSMFPPGMSPHCVSAQCMSAAVTTTGWLAANALVATGVQPGATAVVTVMIVLLNTSFSYWVQVGNARQLPIAASRPDTLAC